MDVASGYDHDLLMPPGRRLYPLWVPPPHRPSIVLTRDFSSFPFRLMDLTEEELNDSRFRNCLKFWATCEYTAYIPSQFQNYIQPQHIYVESEAVAMAEARRCFWGKTSDVEKARYRTTHSAEYRELDKLWDELNSKYNRAHESSYAMIAGSAFVNELRKVEAGGAIHYRALKTKDIVVMGVILSLLFLIWAWHGKKF